jgi:hypothetical protein
MLHDADPHYCREYIEHTIELWIRTEYKNVPVCAHSTTETLKQIFQLIERVCIDISAGSFYSIDDYLGTM